MTLSEAEKVKVGDKVRWTEDEPIEGEVTETGYTGFKVRWIDGNFGIFFFRDEYNTLQHVERV